MQRRRRRRRNDPGQGTLDGSPLEASSDIALGCVAMASPLPRTRVHPAGQGQDRGTSARARGRSHAPFRGRFHVSGRRARYSPSHNRKQRLGLLNVLCVFTRAPSPKRRPEHPRPSLLFTRLRILQANSAGAPLLKIWRGFPYQSMRRLTHMRHHGTHKSRLLFPAVILDTLPFRKLAFI